ncbi:MAG: DUF1640 domain-containing protein [Nitrospirae bacterium]|nr:DUF1640 domain-containing protein [Nitrospirota bacterium]
MATTFDTLKFVENLKKSGFSEEQAKGLSDALKDVQDSSMGITATKGDLKELKSEIISDIVKWVAAMLVAQAAVIAALVRLFGLK